MLKYLVVEISGKQFKVEPNKYLLVDYLGETKKIDCDKVLIKSEDGKLMIGSPYLKEKVVFEVADEVSHKKIRVATFKAKANTRKNIGGKILRSKIRLVA